MKIWILIGRWLSLFSVTSIAHVCATNSWSKFKHKFKNNFQIDHDKTPCSNAHVLKSNKRGPCFYCQDYLRIMPFLSFLIFFIEKLSITEALNERFKNNYFRAFMIFFFFAFSVFILTNPPKTLPWSVNYCRAIILKFPWIPDLTPCTITKLSSWTQRHCKFSLGQI